MKEDLVDYLLKIQNVADYLARGEQLENPDSGTAIFIVQDEDVEERNAFSVCEYNIYDTLEEFYYGEQRSIRAVMDYINDGEYERQIKGRIDFNVPYVPPPDNATFYHMVMRRVKFILKTIGMAITFGGRVALKKVEFTALKREYLEEDDFHFFEDEETGFLQYDLQRRCFYASDSEGEVIIEEVPVAIALKFYNQFFFKKEQDELARQAIEKIQTDKTQNVEDEQERTKAYIDDKKRDKSQETFSGEEIE